jgi:hypothetical protein
MASPQTVTISDRAFGGAVLSSVRIQRAMRGSGAGRAASACALERDTKFAAAMKKVYRVSRGAASPGG